MDEVEFVCRAQGILSSESESDSEDKSDFDEEFEALRPSPVSLKDRQQDIIKVMPFKTVNRRYHTTKKNLYLKNVNSKNVGVSLIKSNQHSKLNLLKDKNLRCKDKQESVKPVYKVSEGEEHKSAFPTLVSSSYFNVSDVTLEGESFAGIDKCSSTSALGLELCKNNDEPLLNQADSNNRDGKKYIEQKKAKKEKERINN